MLNRSEGDDELGPSVQRERLLAGLRYLLVDEYQDVNADHYALISAVAGRTLSSEEDKLLLSPGWPNVLSRLREGSYQSVLGAF